MKVADATAEAVKAFDYAFPGNMHQQIYLLHTNCLPKCNIGALLGPSGSGKSVNMRTQWRPTPTPMAFGAAIVF